jgi:hypothetical protein
MVTGMNVWRNVNEFLRVYRGGQFYWWGKYNQLATRHWQTLSQKVVSNKYLIKLVMIGIAHMWIKLPYVQRHDGHSLFDQRKIYMKYKSWDK